MKSVPNESVAIVGIGCRFPGESHHPEIFWNNLLAGKDCLNSVPRERWDYRKYFDPNPEKPGKISVNSGGFLQHAEITHFDPLAFGMSPREAETLDPQQRLLLETTWEAIEDSGITLSTLQNNKTAVVVGGFHLENYLIHLSAANQRLASQHSPANVMMTMLSNKISYVFDLKGPSFSIDTACSSSLTALEIAFKKIQSGECDMAICGGANIMISPATMILLSKGHFLSDKSRAFSDHAKGYGRGEGAGIVILKPVSKALQEGDPIYALIRNVGINHDGRTTGITFPNQYAQVELMKKVYHEIDVSPAMIHYIEAHGTGTTAGDKAETWSINEVFKHFKNRDNPVLVGSVKANIGHTEAAAGVAGVIKAALILKHRKVPLSIHSSRLNPEIPFHEMCLSIPQSNISLPVSGDLHAGVNSFGYGGANAHALLASAPVPETAVTHSAEVIEIVSAKNRLIPISAKSQESLTALARSYGEFIKKENPTLGDLCHSLVHRRSFHELRAVFQTSDLKDLTSMFETWAPDVRDPKIITGRVASKPPKILFVFTGVGPQWHAMGRTLYETMPVYRESINACDKIIRDMAGWSLVEELLRNKEDSRVNDTDIMQPALVSVQIALTRLWQHFGIVPEGIVGHSLGEISAAYASGAIDLAQALRIAVLRGDVLSRLEGKGSMLAVGLSEIKVSPLISGYSEKVSIAAINDHNSVTLSGDTQALENISHILDKDEIFNRFLKVKVPFHSPVTETVLEEFIEKMGEMPGVTSRIRFFSSQLGKVVDGKDINTDYWCGNIRRSVFFSQAFEVALSEGFDCFIEIGPHPVLKNSIDSLLSDHKLEGKKYPSLIRETDEMDTLYQTLATLFVSGVNIRWDAVIPEKGTYIKLPSYPWNKQAYWLESEESKQDRLGRFDSHVCLQKKMNAPGFKWETELNEFYFPFLKDHVVQGNIAFPGAAYIEAGFAIQQEVFNTFPVMIEDMIFDKMLVYDADDVQPIHIDFNAHTGQFHFYASKASHTDAWMQYATGRIVTGFENIDMKPLNVAELKRGYQTTFDPAVLYAKFERLGIYYGPTFQTIKAYYGNAGLALVNIKLPEQCLEDRFIVHPALMDGAFQAVLNVVDDRENSTFVPVKIGKILLLRSWPDEVWAHLKVVWQSDKAIEVDMDIGDTQGNSIARLTSCQFSHIASSDSVVRDTQMHYELKAETVAADHVHIHLNPAESLVIYRGKPSEVLSTKVKHLLELERLQEEAPLYLKQNNISVIVLDLHLFDQNISESHYPELIHACENLIGLSKALLDTGKDIHLVLYEVTHGIKKAQLYFDLWAYSLYGFLKVLSAELPNVKFTYMQLDMENEAVFTDQPSLPNVANHSLIVYENGQYAIETLVPREINTSQTVMISSKTKNCVLVRQGHRIADIGFSSSDLPLMQPSEILIRVHSAVLSDTDLLKVTNKLSHFETRNIFSQQSVGLECTGVVQEKGEQCTLEVQKGDMVTVGFARDCLQPWLNTDSPYIFKKINHLDVEDANIWVPFVTAYYGLVHKAELQKGESVLIHNAAGSVGIAAIQIAKHIGASMYVTAGSVDKREFLKAFHPEGIYDSRGLNYAHEIMEATQGKGVDVVLNANRGEQLRQSFSLLADYGRYVEIGKKSIIDNEGLPMRPFDRNIAFFGLDMDRLALDKPEVFKTLHQEIAEGFEKGYFTKIPVTVFPASHIQDAFNFLARGEHTGRVAVNFNEQLIPVRRQLKGDVIHSLATYIVTGGLSGFGLKVAEWLGDNGAKHLVLISRSGSRTPENSALLDALQKRGVHLKVKSVDVTKTDEVQIMFNELKHDMPPVEGIIHSAMVLDDRAVFNMDKQAFENVLNPKILGALNLHLCSMNLQLKFFVNFSSVSSIIGNPGQSNYAVANSFLDAFSHLRRGMGLVATTINWGAIGDIGVVARNKSIEEKLVAGGVMPIPIKEALKALGQVLLEDKTHVGVIHMEWDRWASNNPSTAVWPLFSKIITAKKQGLSEEKIQALFAEKNKFLESSGHTESDFYAYLITKELARLLNLKQASISYEDTLNNIGIDSLMAVELSADLQKEYGLKISSFEILNGIAVKALGKKLQAHLDTMGS